MDTVRELILKKSPRFIIVTLVFLLITYLLRWRLFFDVNGLYFLTGGVLGIYFLDAAEKFFNIHPSPFRSIVFLSGFTLVSLFVVTSSGSFLGIGLVLVMYLNLIYWLAEEWHHTKSNSSWYMQVAIPVSLRAQIMSLLIFVGIFVFETYMFIRS